MHSLLRILIICTSANLLIAGGISAQNQPYPVTPKRLELKNDSSFWYPSEKLNKKRLWTVSGIAIGTYAGMYGALGAAWYSDVTKSKFHWFDDSHEWKQVDKLGHAFGGYQGSRGMIQLLKWSGAPKKHTLIFGGATGFLMLAPVEIFDGVSAEWGASASDLVADFVGAGIATANEALWNEQRIQMKISFHPTPYSDIRPDLLGGVASKFVKDYNGHTTWLTFRMDSFLPEGKMKKAWPDWLNLAVGYGAEGMLGGYDDPDGEWRTREFRQWYLSLDLDLTNIKTRSGFLKWLFGTVSFLHLPAPAIEYSREGIRFFGFFM